MFVSCRCYVLSGRGLRDELITRPEESYRLWCVVVCDLENSWVRRPWPTGGCWAKNKQKTNTRWRSMGSRYTAACFINLNTGRRSVVSLRRRSIFPGINFPIYVLVKWLNGSQFRFWQYTEKYISAPVWHGTPKFYFSSPQPITILRCTVYCQKLKQKLCVIINKKKG